MKFQKNRRTRRAAAASPRSRDIWSWISLVFLGFLWGSSYIFIKKGLEGFSAIQVATLRITIAAAAFLPVAVYYLRKIRGRVLIPVALVGFVGSFFPAFLFAFGQTRVSSAVAGILSSLTPLFTLVVGVLFFKQDGSKRKLAGVILGFTGAIGLIMSRGGGVAGDWRYGLLIVLATAFYAISSNIIHTRLKAVPPLALGAISFLFIGIPASLMLAQTDVVHAIQTDPVARESFLYLLVLALLGTFAATMIYFRLVQKEGAVFATMVGYFFPLVATFLGYLDGEVLRPEHFIGMILILGGVYVLRHSD